MGTIAPDRILKELSNLWVTLAKDEKPETGAGVLRACSMTLLVLAEEAEDVSPLGETLAALMPEHPARTILVRLRGPGEASLGERVYAQCWMPFGQRRQICCEHIEITATDAALGDLASVVLPLAVPDLPMMIWCRSPRLVEMPEFRNIAGMAQKVILDSAGFGTPNTALSRMADLERRGLLLGDLAWTRLTRWREMLAQVFENQQYLDALPSVREVRVRFDEPNNIAAYYLGGWVQGRLAAAGVRVTPDVAPGETFSLELTGDALRLSLARSDQRLRLSVNELSTCTSLTLPTDYLLLREELRIVGRDRAFESALANAAALAYPTER